MCVRKQIFKLKLELSTMSNNDDLSWDCLWNLLFVFVVAVVSILFRTSIYFSQNNFLFFVFHKLYTYWNDYLFRFDDRCVSNVSNNCISCIFRVLIYLLWAQSIDALEKKNITSLSFFLTFSSLFRWYFIFYLLI